MRFTLAKKVYVLLFLVYSCGGDVEDSDTKVGTQDYISNVENYVGEYQSWSTEWKFVSLGSIALTIILKQKHVWGENRQLIHTNR